MTFTHFISDTLTLQSKTYHTDFIRYHLHYSDSKFPDRICRLVNEGMIIQCLDDMELKVGEAIARQVELWKKTVAIRRLSSTVIPRRCSVLKAASPVCREKRYLSVWFIFEDQRLCLRVQPLYFHDQYIQRWEQSLLCHLIVH